MPLIARAPLLALVVAALGLPGCAGRTCQKTKAAFEQFEGRRATLNEPHAKLTIPHRTLNLMLATAARKLPSVDVPVPAVAGVSLGRVRATVEGITSRAAAPDTVGLTVLVALRSGNRTLLGLELDADLRPQVDAANHQVTVPLRGEDLRGVRPRLGPGGTKALVDYAYAQLPAAARAMISKRDVADAIEGAVDELGSRASSQLVAAIGKNVDTIAEIEIDLGPLPVQAIALQSNADAVVLGIVTPLPVARGVDLAPDPADPQTVALRMSASAVAELANHALRTGLVPDRYDDAGESSPSGRWTARFDHREGPQPIRLQLWSLSGDCARVELAATPQLTVADGHLQFRTDDARIVDVDGSARIRAGIVFSGLGRRTFTWVEQLASSFTFDVADQPVTARIMAAQPQQNGDLLLRLAVAPPR